MKIDCDHRYLLFPVSTHAQKKSLRFHREGQLLLDLDLSLDNVTPDYEVAVDIGRFGPGEMVLSCIPEMEVHARPSDDPGWQAGLYKERFRPRFHFSTKRGWINDPNGLVYYRGNYHLFYQYNPVGCAWGNMHWGHAVSPDLLHWEEWETALFPDEGGTMFSGSAIVDTENTLGLNTADQEAILLFYTAAGNTSLLSKDKPSTQNLAYSIDGGRTFHKHARNPIVPQIAEGNRDPKIIRSPVKGHWVMALFLTGMRYALLSSTNLLDWVVIQELDLPDDSECPDFFPLTIRGGCTEGAPIPNASENTACPDATGQAFPATKIVSAAHAKSSSPVAPQEFWVLCGAADRYQVGTFDGHRFIPDGSVKRLHYGSHSYAAQSWSNIPASDGRRIRIAWNTFDIPGMPFNKCMTLPCEMSLRTLAGERMLCAWPIREVETLHRNARTEINLAATSESPFVMPLAACAHDIHLRIRKQDAESFTLSLFGLDIVCNMLNRRLECLDKTAPFEPNDDGFMALRLIMDTTGAELFLNEGSVYLSNGFPADWNLNRLEIRPCSGSMEVEILTVAELPDIWA